MTVIPAAAKDLFHKGVRLMEKGNAAQAETAFREALRLAPELAEAHANLGLLLAERQCWQEAEAHYCQAIALHPHQSQTYLNFGTLLAAQKRFPEAEAACRQALLLNPDSPATLSNLGVLLTCMKREQEAEACYRAAMAIDPDYRKAFFNLAYLLLRQGRYEEGWACMENRDWYGQLAERLHCPRWQGESLDGKSILISIEAGHGDMIQFCRYASLLKKRGAARVSVLCHPGLKTLFAGLTGADAILSLDDPAPPDGWDCWVPPLSLPFLFGARLDTIPAHLPYLVAAPERITHWAAVMGAKQERLRVGLVWKGSPGFENDADRSLPSLATLASLGDIPGIRYFSLQKGRGEDEAAAPPPPLSLTDLGPQIADFADTAAIVMNLDLVISVDTAVAHLAGALGKPCWVLLPDYKTDWRWLADRNDSPWYPQVMCLFRQQTAGDWSAPLAAIRTALQKSL